MTEVTKSPFGTMPDGRAIELYTLRNARGTTVAVTTYGARLVSFARKVNGTPIDIVLGYRSGADYLRDTTSMGGVVGRHANRIADGRVTIGGHTYQLEQNSGSHKQNHIHGGTHGLHYHLWTAEPVADGVALTAISPEGEGGYPGNLEATVTYRLTDDDALILSYRAVSDADTVCNLTNHAYFNLDGTAAPSVMEHTAEIFADEFTWADAESLPDGRILPVADTPMDFRAPHRIGERIDADYDGCCAAIPPPRPMPTSKRRRASRAHRRGSPSTAGRPSRGCSSTRQTPSASRPSSARAVLPTHGAVRSALRHSSSRTHSRIRISHSPSCVRARSGRRRPSTARLRSERTTSS